MTPSTVRLKQLAENMEADCGDNSCRFAKNKSGMRTNGGCRCVAIRDPSLRHFFYAANPEAVLGLIARIEKLEVALEKISRLGNYAGNPTEQTKEVLTRLIANNCGPIAREALKEET